MNTYENQQSAQTNHHDPHFYNEAGTGDAFVKAIAADGDGNVFVTGAIGGSAGIGISSPFTIAYSRGGTPLWTNRFEIPDGVANFNAIAADNAGNVFLTGWAGVLGNHTSDDFVTIKYAAQNPSPPLEIQRLGNSVVLSWTDAAFGLQSAPTITGTFTNVSGAASPYTNAITGGQRFFRLAK